MSTVAIVELTDEKRLVQAKLEAVDIRKQAKVYFEYMKANPHKLDGTYIRKQPHIKLTFDGERYQMDSKMLGLTTYQSGRYWFDDKSIIMQVDTVGTTRDKSKSNRNVWIDSNTADGDDLLLSTKPIMNSRKKTVRYQRQ